MQRGSIERNADATITIPNQPTGAEEMIGFDRKFKRLRNAGDAGHVESGAVL
jgi:hypothetical protein